MSKLLEAIIMGQMTKPAGGDTSVNNYNNLLHKPSVEGVILHGDLTHEDLNIVGRDEFEETQQFLGTEAPFNEGFTDKRIIPALNELELEANGASEIIKELQDEVNHTLIDEKEQVYQYFLTDFNHYLFQNNNYFLDGEISYNVPSPQEVYVKLDFSRVVPMNDDTSNANHVFGVYRNNYNRILAIYCTNATDSDEKIKLTMLQGGYTIEVEIMPDDVVGVVSGTGYHKLYVNGKLIQEIPNSAKAEKFVLGNANNNMGFQPNSQISYKAYVMDINLQMEKIFMAEPIDVIEDIAFVDKTGDIKKYYIPQSQNSNGATIIKAMDAIEAQTVSANNPNALVWW